MILSSASVVAFGASLLVVSAAGSPARGSSLSGANIKRDAALDDWISREEPTSYAGILANIGEAGERSYRADRGLLLASPSTVDPDYFYTWTRDSALTFKALVDRFFVTKDGILQIHINDYIAAQARLQPVSNPSGTLLPDGSGLGEPKFQPNGTAFTGSWGRPQRDGPALRATALITYGKWLLSNGHRDAAANNVWPIVANDLAYVAQYWNETGFDLWEEVRGSSFFTSAAQHRALVEGSSFAASIGSSCAACDSQAPKILCFLQTYWNGEYIVSNTNIGTGNSPRSGKDVNSILTTLTTFDPLSPTCSDITYQPCSHKALANHKVVTDAFRSLYALNANISVDAGVAVGRYPEDVYYGGNPWYLATLAAAEQLYLAHAQITRHATLSITSVDIAFWKALDAANAAEGTFPASSQTFTALTSALKAYADSYVAVAQKYTPEPYGALAEQFERSTGAPLSAKDLTWSYAAFLTTIAARDGELPGSWGAANISSVPPETCVGGGVAGTYTAPPTNLTWPDVVNCPVIDDLHVTFNVLTRTVVGQDIFVVGNVPALGNWNVDGAVKLQAMRYREADFPLWFGGVELARGQRVEYKYIRKDGGAGNESSVVWEDGANRVVEVQVQGPGCRDAIAVGDQW
ncbi:carbohydrate-binding module family 20 protein [Periconia macrospinosa]|uniref:Glucoamylase n=1 Tax=Periconia macrospinosa TaxID=97972 RepID=A0A2V1D239_9PLEO|nr:carbohydrate-binding module family 20 protein [Periconia macrospinosa]